MDLRSMVLIELEKGETAHYFPSHLSYNNGECAIFSRIEQPLQYEDYEKLVLEFLKHRFAYRVVVRNREVERTFLKSEVISQKILDEIIDIARADPLKKGIYLDFKMPRGENYMNWSAFLFFVEQKEKIAVSRAIVPCCFDSEFHMERYSYFYTRNKAVTPQYEINRFSREQAVGAG